MRIAAQYCLLRYSSHTYVYYTRDRSNQADIYMQPLHLSEHKTHYVHMGWTDTLVTHYTHIVRTLLIIIGDTLAQRCDNIEHSEYW